MDIRERRHWPASAFLLGLLLSLGLLGLRGDEATSLARADSPSASDSPYIIPNLFADLAETTLPSVVSVYIRYDRKQSIADIQKRMEGLKEFFDDPTLDQFFDERKKRADEEDDPHNLLPERRTSGSGVIISRDGFIVTNNHIVAEANGGKLGIVLHDNTEIPPEKIRIVATDTLLDIAVLKIDAEGLDLKPVKWGDSDRLRIGDWVISIGNPLDLRGSVSKGIVSAKGRKIGKVGIEHLIQTDAMINPGSSGGALINLDGELIGINMAIATTSGYFQGIGFAIPSNDARFITDQVIKTGKIQRGWIGIEMRNLTDANRRRASGMKPGESGILVFNIHPDAPAKLAGVQDYDIISKVDGRKILDTSDLLELIASKRVGETAELTVLRIKDGKLREIKLDMKVQTRPPDEVLEGYVQAGGGINNLPEAAPSTDELGLILEAAVSPKGRPGLLITVVKSGSPAARANLAEDDYILEIDREPVETLGDYRDAVEGLEKGQRVFLRYFDRATGREQLTTIARGG